MTLFTNYLPLLMQISLKIYFICELDFSLDRTFARMMSTNKKQNAISLVLKNLKLD